MIFLFSATQASPSGSTGKHFTVYVQSPTQDLAEEGFRNYYNAIVDSVEEVKTAPPGATILNWRNRTR